MPKNESSRGVFVNFSNHPSADWPPEQIAAARRIAGGGVLRDLPFPQVPPDADEREILRIAADCAEKIAAMRPAAVMCMGEFGVCFAAVSLLKARGILCVYSCTERQSTEKASACGTEKRSVYVFRRFRAY